MKTKYLALFACVCCLFHTSLHAQKNVTIQQNKIIGSLPYGVHFYLNGSATLPNGEVADSLVVQIYEIEREKSRNFLSRNIDNSQNPITGKIPIDRSVWARYKETDATNFKVYINKPLKFGLEYSVELNFYCRHDFKFTTTEKSEILNRVKQNAEADFAKNGFLVSNDASDYLNSAIYTAMQQKIQAAGNAFNGLELNNGNSSALYSVTKNYLQSVNDLAGLTNNLKQDKKNLADFEKQLSDAQKAPTPNASGIKRLNRRIASTEDVVNNLEKKIRHLNTVVDNNLIIVGNQLVLVSVSQIEGETLPIVETELQAIRFGTSFGGGGVFLNPQNSELRDINPLAYSAMRFYLFPVDKRVVKPYLTNNILNRASILFGVVNSGAFKYRGQVLEKPLNIAPLLGVSYDFNRYLSLDVSATLFEQPSPSPLISRKRRRFAPVVGVSFDLDVFNRIKSLSDNGSNYRLPVTGN